MTITDHIKMLSSINLHKYEYFTGEDLSLKPNIVEEAKFKYSLLVKVYNKGLNENEKKKVRKYER